MSAPSRIPLKLVLVGDGTVGKTSLLAAYKTGRYPEKFYEPTIQDDFTQDLSVDSRDIKLSIYDTAGQEGYESLRPLSYKDANVFLVCYSVENWESYENVRRKWVPDLKRYNEGQIETCVLVALKTDLRTDYTTLEELKKMKLLPVSTQDGQRMANEIGAASFLECSARAMRGVDNVFQESVRAHFRPQRPIRRKRKDCSLL